MTDREKLIELMNENFTEYCNVDIVAGHCKIRAITFDVDRFADFLISNGVTVQKWIPVSERLPEELHWGRYGNGAAFTSRGLYMLMSPKGARPI